jgi:trehalose 6-phosphate phosphatase
VGSIDATIARAVSVLAHEPAATALLLDFDGSLAPIVLQPEQARPLPGTAEVLEAIGRRLGLVAIVSGRPVDFLVEWVPAPDVRLVGQYGLEWVENGRIVVDERARPYLAAVKEALDTARREFPDCYIERKGDVAVTVHWRRAPHVEADVIPRVEAIGARLGLTVHPGRLSRELRPPIPVDKGSVVASFVDGFDVAAFAGDDAGDVPAFDAIARLRASGRLRDALRIAVASPEAPREVLDGGDVVVDGPEGLRALLDALAAAL